MSFRSVERKERKSSVKVRTNVGTSREGSFGVIHSSFREVWEDCTLQVEWILPVDVFFV